MKMEEKMKKIGLDKHTFISIGLAIALILASFWGGRLLGIQETKLDDHIDHASTRMDLQFKNVNARLDRIDRRLNELQKIKK